MIVKKTALPVRKAPSPKAESTDWPARLRTSGVGPTILVSRSRSSATSTIAAYLATGLSMSRNPRGAGGQNTRSTGCSYPSASLQPPRTVSNDAEPRVAGWSGTATAEEPRAAGEVGLADEVVGAVAGELGGEEGVGSVGGHGFTFALSRPGRIGQHP